MFVVEANMASNENHFLAKLRSNHSEQHEISPLQSAIRVTLLLLFAFIEMKNDASFNWLQLFVKLLSSRLFN